MHADRLRPAVIVSVCCPHQDTGEPQFATASLIICLCALQNVLWLSNLEFLYCFALLPSRSLILPTTSWSLAQLCLSQMLLNCLLLCLFVNYIPDNIFFHIKSKSRSFMLQYIYLIKILADYRLEVSICMWFTGFWIFVSIMFLVKIRFSSFIFLLLKSIAIIIVKCSNTHCYILVFVFTK